jgi:hypothetical protein
MKHELKQIDAHTRVLVEIPEPEKQAEPETARRGRPPKVKDDARDSENAL